MENRLPVGWIWTTLGNVCETTSGGTPDRKNKSYYTGAIPWVKSGELSSDIIDHTEEMVTEAAIKNSSAKIFPIGTLLIALYGTTTGKLAFLGIEAATNQAIAGIFPSIGIDKKYVYYYLLFYRDELLLKRIGTAQPNISQTILNKIPFPLPPSSEQTRIVTTLDEYMDNFQKAEKILTQIPPLLLEFRQKVLSDAVSGKLTKRKKKWQNLSAKDVCEIIQIGPFGTQLHKEDYISNGIPLINPSHIKKAEIIPDLDQTITKEKFEELTNYHLTIGDIVMGRRGEMGRCALITENENGWICGTGSLFFRPNRKFVNPDFLYWILSSSDVKDFLEKSSLGSTMMNLNLKIVKSIPLFIPSLYEQTEIVRRVKELFNAANAIEAAYKTTYTELKALPQMFLSKAFKGELLPPSVSIAESAEQLLELIKIEKIRLATEKGIEKEKERQIRKTQPKMKEMDLKPKSIETVLAENATHRLTAKEVWQQSEWHYDIEKFYAHLTKLINDKIISEERRNNISYLSLKTTVEA